MKKVKKFLALALASVMMLSVIVASPVLATDEPEEMYPDVCNLDMPSDYYAADELEPVLPNYIPEEEINHEPDELDEIFEAAEFSTIEAASGCTHCTEYSCALVSSHTVTHSMSTPGPNDAPWRLYSCGTVVVDAGFIDWCGVDSWGISAWSGTSAQRIVFTGPITAGTYLRALFAGLQVTSIEGLEHFDTSNTTNMDFMFRTMSNLRYLNLSDWDVSNVTTMDSMFFRSSLVSVDLSEWDTGNVTNMSTMFVSASNLTYLNLSGWDTSRVTDMNHMFAFTTNLTDLDLSGWDT